MTIRPARLARLVAAAAAAVAFLTITGCGDLPPYYNTLDYQAPAGVTVTPGPGAATAFYATNRQDTGSPGSAAYSPRRADRLALGDCAIKVPRVHRIGADVVTEQLSRVWQRPQREYFELTAVHPAATDDAFYAALRAAIDNTPGKDVLILVHGYNNTFDGPVTRAAELAYDLGARVVPIAYCWTSQGTPQGYASDENDTDAAARHLAAFLGTLLDRVPAGTRLHLVAHSMGSRVTTLALARLKATRNPPGKPFKNLVFAAADIDAAEFKARMTDDGLAHLADRTTLYAAYNDHALQASEYAHNPAYPRAGRAGESILVIPGVDTVDVSLNDASVVGHSYYGDNRAVINDLHMLLVLNQAPDHRNLYKATAQNGSTYWLIRP